MSQADNLNVSGNFTASGINEALSMAIGHVRLGDLLKASGIVSYEFLKEALTNFEEKGLPLGKVLLMSGFLTEDELQVALEIQTLVNNRQLPFDVGVRVLTMSHEEKIGLADAFTRASVVQPEDLLSNKLGQLLTLSGLISEEDLDNALSINQRTGLPLGHVFCYRGLLSQQLLDTALLGQQLVRRGSLSRDNCINALYAAKEREATLSKLTINAGYRPVMRKGTPRLGELFFTVGLLDDMALLSALQLSLTHAIPCGQAMCEIAGVPSEVVDISVYMQEMIDNETLTADQARDVFTGMRELEHSFPRALAESSVAHLPGNPARMFVQLLRDTCGLKFGSDDISIEIAERLEVNYNQGGVVAKLLTRLPGDALTDHQVWSALRLTYYLYLESLPYERAIVAFDGAMQENITVDEALVRLGAICRTRLKFA